MSAAVLNIDNRIFGSDNDIWDNLNVDPNLGLSLHPVALCPPLTNFNQLGPKPDPDFNNFNNGLYAITFVTWVADLLRLFLSENSLNLTNWWCWLGSFLVYTLTWSSVFLKVLISDSNNTNKSWNTGHEQYKRQTLIDE